MRLHWRSFVAKNVATAFLGFLGTASTNKIVSIDAQGDKANAAIDSCPGVNFTNILRADFSYKFFLRSFDVLTIWVCNFLVKGFWRKSCS